MKHIIIKLNKFRGYFNDSIDYIFNDTFLHRIFLSKY